MLLNWSQFPLQIVEVVEADIKAMEKNVSKFRNISYSMDDADVTQAERLYNCQVKHYWWRFDHLFDS